MIQSRSNLNTAAFSSTPPEPSDRCRSSQSWMSVNQPRLESSSPGAARCRSSVEMLAQCGEGGSSPRDGGEQEKRRLCSRKGHTTTEGAGPAGSEREDQSAASWQRPATTHRHRGYTIGHTPSARPHPLAPPPPCSATEEIQAEPEPPAPSVRDTEPAHTFDPPPFTGNQAPTNMAPAQRRRGFRTRTRSPSELKQRRMCSQEACKGNSDHLQHVDRTRITDRWQWGMIQNQNCLCKVSEF